MNAVDTNILLYSVDRNEPAKQLKAQRLLQQLHSARRADGAALAGVGRTDSATGGGGILSSKLRMVKGWLNGSNAFLHSTFAIQHFLELDLARSVSTGSAGGWPRLL